MEMSTTAFELIHHGLSHWIPIDPRLLTHHSCCYNEYSRPIWGSPQTVSDPFFWTKSLVFKSVLLYALFFSVNSYLQDLFTELNVTSRIGTIKTGEYGVNSTIVQIPGRVRVSVNAINNIEAASHHQQAMHQMLWTCRGTRATKREGDWSDRAEGNQQRKKLAAREYVSKM